MKSPPEEGTVSRSRSQLIDAFRMSKAKIKAWESSAGPGADGKRPSLASAPKAIQICYKNCKKIQFYLDNLEKAHKKKSEEALDAVPLRRSVSTPAPTTTWGPHLNIRAVEGDQKGEEKDLFHVQTLTPFLGPSKVRTSLKRKKCGSSSPFLGNLHEESSSEKDDQQASTEKEDIQKDALQAVEGDDQKEVEDGEEMALDPTSSLLKWNTQSSAPKTTIQLTTRMDGGVPNEVEDELGGAPRKRPRIEETEENGVDATLQEQEDTSVATKKEDEEYVPSGTSKSEKLLSKKKSWNDNYRRINLKKKTFTRFNKGIARKREANANKSKMRTQAKGGRFNASVKTSEKGSKAMETSPLVLPEPILTLSEVQATSTMLEKSDEDLDALVHTTLQDFGHVEFRKGQKEAILRVLRGKSTLVVLSTGSGKSLIYQIPAYLLGKEDNRLTIVVSPLVSLMEDQLRNMPSLIQADLLHSDISGSQMEKIKNDLRENKLFILFMTPETLFSQLKILREFIPRIGFVCIDEAHCMSQWSHNFRPAYFQLGGAIRESLKTTTVLGLTATATEKTIATVAERLVVDSESGGIIKGCVLRNNLLMSVSKDLRRDEALMELLNSDKFSSLSSIIIYCTRREECERVAATIRTRRRSEMTSKNKEVASSFHAGLSLAKRRRIYNDFIAGKLKIIVATIAFGMGINKSDIRGVIHYNMPSTLESYVQEIGRAGRDGKESFCHLFMDSKGKDLNELKRHVYSNSVDRVIVRKFVGCIFNDKTFSRTNGPYRDVILHAYNLVELLDMPEENITTLMCYLENDPGEWIKVKRQISDVVKVQIYGSAEKVRSKISDHGVLDYILSNKTSDQSYKVTEIAKELSMTCEAVWDSLVKLKYSGVTLDFGQSGFYLRVKNDVDENDLDNIQNLLCDKISEREKSEIYKLQRTFRTFLSVSHESVDSCISSFDHESCQKLNKYITDYFSEQEDLVAQTSESMTPVDEKPIRQQIRQFLSIYSDQNWTGRSVARVFHGIPSPNFPAQTWYRARGYWKAYMDLDFNVILRLATKEIIGLRTGLS